MSGFFGNSSSSILKQTGIATSTITTNVETNQAIVTVPAGLMGANGRLHIVALWTFVGVANTKIVRIRFSATSGDTSTGFLLQDFTTAAGALTFGISKSIWNANATNAQIALLAGSGGQTDGTGSVSSANITGSIDTTAATYVNFNSACTNNSVDTARVSAYSVTWFPGV